MEWIVLGEKNGKIQLVSKSQVSGILPKGSFLTIEDENKKFILRVEGSIQEQPYSPNPMIIDMDLSSLIQDRKCQNIIVAYRIKDITTREDGLIDFIRPQSLARRSTQEEIDLAIGSNKKGPRVFLATVHSNQNQLLIDEKNNFMTTQLPEDMFFYQLLVCGKTGSGKTVALKYLSQYFVEEMGGAVLAINVKEADLLTMDKPSNIKDITIQKEWKTLNFIPRGLRNFSIYYPASADISSKKINKKLAKPVTLNINEIDPESFTGLLQNITDIGAQNLPNIFSYWKEHEKKDDDKFKDFIDYFNNASNDNCIFKTLNLKGDISEVTLAKSTFNNISRNLDNVSSFFDNDQAVSLSAKDILQPSTFSVIDVVVKNGTQFGAILLRDLLHKIVEEKNSDNNVPILIMIDEVHTFYNSQSMSNALGDLDTICRTGRSKKIGVVFSSQNPQDLPKGLSSVINTKIFFKTEATSAKLLGMTVNTNEVENLKAGFCVCSIHDVPQIKTIKFPLSLAGVINDGK
ncbi:MAG: helicase HerA-like domain-containing protein [Candidatus Nanoarchaeia archaeon]|jgi:hypothetical protein